MGSTCARETSRIVCTGVSIAEGRNQIIAVTVGTAPSLRAGATWTAYGIGVRTAANQTVETNGVLARTGPPVAPIRYTVDALTGVVQPGGTATLTVNVHNDGPSDATGVTAKVIAPSQTTFGALSGRVAQDCSRASSTLLDCRFGQPVADADLTWIIPLLVSSTASTDDPVAGGCVSTNNDTDCDDPTDELIPNYALGRPLGDVASIDFTAVTVAPGSSGSPQLVLNSRVDLDNLTLTVPVGNLPETFEVTGQQASSGDCAQTTNAVVCTGITMIADVAVTVDLTVAVDADAPSTARWRGVGVSLADDDGSDPLTASGLLASTTAADFDVVVTPGSPSPNPVAPGQTTRLPVTLHNNGPSDAPGYELVVVLPQGTAAGSPLPSGCTASRSNTVVSCVRDIAADETIVLSIPMVPRSGLADGTVLTGGCFDNVGGDTFDYVCTGADDQALPTVLISDGRVDLKIRYLNPRPRAVAGGTVRLGLPYSNVGNDSAAGVQFRIDPPAGVRVTAADILLDASGSNGEEPAADETVEADCAAADDGDENTVVCSGPDAAVGETSQLWMSLYIAPDAPKGRFPITVTISTTSPEGNTVNNFAVAQFTIAGEGDDPDRPRPNPNVPGDDTNHGGGGWDNLPKTGQNVFGLVALSILLVLAGALILAVARDRPKPDPHGTL